MTLWWGTLGGLTAWAVHLVLGYLAFATICGEERRLALEPTVVFLTLSVAALAAALHAALLALRTWRRGDGAPSRLAFGGLLLDALAAIAIVAGGVIPAFLRPCG